MLYQLIGSGLPFIEVIALILAYMLALMLAFCIHEFSHAFVAYKMGDPTAKQLGRLTLNPFKHIDSMGFLCLIFFGFGWAKPVQVTASRFKKYKLGLVLVSIAGVLANLILAFVFSGVYYFAAPSLASSSNLFFVFIDFFVYYSILLNLSLFVFNLLPVFPLDGFNFIKSITPNNNWFVNFMQKYGTFVLLIFLITPIFDYIFSYVTGGLLSIFYSFWGLF